MAFTATTLSAQLQYSTPELGRRERFRVFASFRASDAKVFNRRNGRRRDIYENDVDAKDATCPGR